MTGRRALVLGPGRHGPPGLVGGKAYGLQRLAALGLPVPRWVTITTDAAALVLAPYRTAIARGCVEPGDLDALVSAAPWPATLNSALARAVARLDARRGLAVRSSVVGEDGADASHAGLFTTLLGQPAAEVAHAVRACWRSAFAAAAADYRRRRVGTNARPRVAVIVQEMVDSQVAGVAFTADPQTGAPAHVVAAGYGLGIGVVSDRVEADLFIRPRGSADWQRRVSHKTRAVRLTPAFRGTETAGVSNELRDQPTLDTAALDRLGAILARLDGDGHEPTDVEWAIAATGELAILQARPLTALPEGAVGVWDDSNIGENFPGLTLPLTASYVRSLYTRLFRRALAEVGVSDAPLVALEPALGRLLDLIHGRLYLNLRNYYRLFEAVPGLGWTVRSWEQALGIAGGEALRGATRALSRRFSLLGLAWTLLRLLRRVRGMDDEVAGFRARVEDFLDRWDGVSWTGRSAGDLMALFHELHGSFVDLWTVHIFNDLLLFVGDAQLDHLLGNPSLHRRLIGGIRDAASLEPLASLLALAQVARGHAELEAILQGPLSPEEAWKRMVALPGAEDFSARAARHLSRYGDRTGEELKLESPTLADEPWLLVSLLRGSRGVAPLEQTAEREAGSRAEAETELVERMAGRPVARRVAGLILRRVRRGVAAREYMSLARARAFGVLRRLVRALGVSLAARGLLLRADDVFYLTTAELDGLVRDPSRHSRLQSAVAHRRQAYGRFGEERLPHRLVCRGSVYRYDWRERDEPALGDSTLLRGIPSAPGIARGRARVVERPSPEVRLQGEILVAPATEPAWMFLMYAARAVVVERGSTLSHAAIIGRELGIPTVVGVASATARIQTGDLVEVNGVTGEVRVLERAQASGGVTAAVASGATCRSSS